MDKKIIYTWQKLSSQEDNFHLNRIDCHLRRGKPEFFLFLFLIKQNLSSRWCNIKTIFSSINGPKKPRLLIQWKEQIFYVQYFDIGTAFLHRGVTNCGFWKLVHEIENEGRLHFNTTEMLWTQISFVYCFTLCSPRILPLQEQNDYFLAISPFLRERHFECSCHGSASSPITRNFICAIWNCG